MIERSNFFYREISTKGVGEATTVSAGPDNGANNAVACAFWRNMRHNNCQQAIDNLLGRYNAEPAAAQNFNISGHGFPGFVEAGKGQGGAWEYSKIIWLYNYNDWTPEFQRIANLNFGIFSIYSCDTGADEDGAQLLFKICKHLNRPARARTGLTNGVTQGSACWIEFQNGSTWQVATPDMAQRPVPIPKSPHLYDFRKQNTYFEIVNEGSVDAVDFAEVKSIEVSFTSPYYSFSSNIISEQFHSHILANLFYTESFLNEGNILGFVTQTVTITTQKNETIIIDIYNNSLGEIRNQKVSFFISNQLINMLTKAFL